MFVTVIVTTFPDAVEVDSTVTSLEPLSDPVPTTVLPTFNSTSPAVSPKPPNLAETEETLTEDGREVVNVILVAGSLLLPSWLYSE